MLTSTKQFIFYLFGKKLFCINETYVEVEEKQPREIVVVSEEYLQREFKSD